MRFLVLIVLLTITVVIIQIEIFTLVLSRLGLSPHSATLLLITTFVGSAINLPLARVSSSFHYDPQNPLQQIFVPFRFKEGTTIISINVGGGLIPIVFSVYLMQNINISMTIIMLAVGVVSAVSYYFSRPITNIGIGMPLLIAPLCAALTAIVLSHEQAPALAYICGSLGVVIGADLLRIKDIRQLNIANASIGGAGTFDGIFMTGIIAVLLTY